MSADLFAEFGVGGPAHQPKKPTPQQPARSQANALIPDLNAFEDAAPFSSSQYFGEPSSQPVQSSSLHAQSTLFDDFDDFQQPQGEKGSEVLFDASLDTPIDDESDGWGEFESADSHSAQHRSKSPVQGHSTVGVPKAKASYASTSSATVSGGLDLMEALSIEERSPPPSSRIAGTLLDDIPKTKSQRNDALSRPKILVQDEPFEEWGDFIDGPATEPRRADASRAPSNPQTSQTATTLKPAERRIAPTSRTPKTSPPPAQVRPTNIPPPSILLELFPRLFEKLRQDGVEAKKNTEMKDNLDSVALSITCTLKAVARVVTGRTLRWKRDAILGQSMRIGPARSGKAGGMKLSTVNKNETIKEQQEAVDVINLWRDRAAFFNSVIQAAGGRPVPVIPENTRVTIQQGALKAPHACALCGLKRDERLPKIDENVEDSFGEWWTDHWGHTDCRQFWETSMGLLDQR